MTTASINGLYVPCSSDISCLQVTHDWNKDEFSNGTWFFAPPKLTTRYLKALQRPHGNVHFASADWSDGWRGWIDGAVQSGAKVAHDVIQIQAQEVTRAKL